MRNRRCQTRLLHIAGAVCSSLAMFACNSPARPSVTIVAGRPTSPAQNAALSYYSQPITLVVTPGVTATGAPPTTVLEVATDSAFASIVFTKTLPPTVNGQTRVALDHLNAATTYYWRVKTTAGDNASVVSAVSTFTIGPQLVIQPPTLVTPLADTFPHKRPTFIVTDSVHTGPPARLGYHFRIASDPGFKTLIEGVTVLETPGQTSYTPDHDLTSGATYYWHAQAVDLGTDVVSDFSSVQSFTTRNPDDGLFRYNLTLHLVSATKCNTTYDRGPFQFLPLPPDVTFDSGLAVSDNQLRYDVLGNYSPALELNMARTEDRLSGTLRTNGLRWTGMVNLGVAGIFIDSVIVMGSVDNSTGRLSGTARGSFDDEGGPPSYIHCPEAELTFTLTPHH